MSLSILHEKRSKHQGLGQAVVAVWVDQGGNTQGSSDRGQGVPDIVPKPHLERGNRRV